MSLQEVEKLISNSLSILDNVYVKNVVKMLLVLYAGLAAPRLPSWLANLFNNSVFRLLKLDLSKKIKLNERTFNLNQHEIEILKKISEWPRCIEISSNKLEPHRIPFYLYQLVTLFHAYWNIGKDHKEYRFIAGNGNMNNSRLVLLQALSIVIKNGMSILGVSTPSSM